jgi:2-(1,2-epoxy-1,2-dihydrophenyl)acetyl-CoA isomerase
MALAMLAESVTAEEAEGWGMIWKAVDDAALIGEAETLAERLAAMPTAALVSIRRAVDAAATNGLDAQLDLERDLQAELGRGDDYAEGVRAFLEKRPAKFGPRGGAA